MARRLRTAWPTSPAFGLSGPASTRPADEAGAEAVVAAGAAAGLAVALTAPDVGRSGRRRWSTRRKILVVLSFLVIVALVAVGGSYIFLQRSIDSINKLHVNDEVAVQSGAPFTVLVIGSDSRVGENSKEFGSAAEVAGQRSDVVQLWRFTPFEEAGAGHLHPA